MSKLLGAFTFNGNLDAELWYVTLFDEVPSKYTLSIENEDKILDPKEITFDKCKHLFSKDVIFRQYTEECEEDSEPEDNIEYDDRDIIPLDNLVFGGERAGSLYIVDNKRVILIVTDKCVVFYSQQDNLEDIKKQISNLWACFPKAQKESKSAKVGLIKYSQGEYYTSFSDIRNTTVNIEENYNDDFLPVYKDIVEFLNQRESGLILLHGKMGSGNFYKKILEFSIINCIFVLYD